MWREADAERGGYGRGRRKRRTCGCRERWTWTQRKADVDAGEVDANAEMMLMRMRGGTVMGVIKKPARKKEADTESDKGGCRLKGRRTRTRKRC